MSIQTAPDYRLRFTGILRSEWIKLITVRSTIASYLVLVVGSVGISFIVAASANTFTPYGSPTDSISLGITAGAMGVGLYIGQFVVAVHGALSITTEFRSGMIRSTLSAVPSRLPVLFAKAVVLFVVTYVIGVVTFLLSYGAVGLVLGSSGFAAAITEPTVLGIIFLAPIYLALFSVFALGLGTMLRSSAGAISTAIALLYVLPIFVTLVFWQTAQEILPYLLANVGPALVMPGTYAAGAEFGPLFYLLVCLGWTAASFGGATLVFKLRDA